MPAQSRQEWAVFRAHDRIKCPGLRERRVGPPVPCSASLGRVAPFTLARVRIILASEQAEPGSMVRTCECCRTAIEVQAEKIEVAA